MFSYKGNYIEAVVFVFYKNGKVLIENRPSNPDHTGPKANFFPSGKIDKDDHNYDEDYRTIALKREILEEFENKIKFKDHHYLGEVKVDPIKIHFYVYLITDFKGSFPKYTIEKGEKFADLFWIDLNDKEKYFIYDSAFQICDMVGSFLSKYQDIK
ncbi:MAG: NUDIX domain-containing protein [Candidatus Thorarchaeota archaeon]